MALTSDAKPQRRGQRFGRSDFGYPVAPGETIYRGGIVCLNSSGEMVRPQTTGAVVFAGLATATYNNASSAAAGPTIVAERGSYALTVASATISDLGKPVYATDDNTFTLTAPSTGFTASIGTLTGIENGQTWVLLEGA
jgi:hypothetical protein